MTSATLPLAEIYLEVALNGGTEIGNRVMDLRDQRNLTQEELAERAGTSPTTISNLESGKIKNPHYRTLRRVATALGVGVGELTAPKALLSQPERDAAAPPEALQEAVAIAWRLLAQRGQGIVERSVREGASRQLSEDLADYHADAARIANIRQAVGVQVTDELADAEDAYHEVENRIQTLLRQDIEDKQTQRLRVKKGERSPEIRGETA
jgi:transcriptional regulator with XRE-family HTH domain